MARLTDLPVTAKMPRYELETLLLVADSGAPADELQPPSSVILPHVTVTKRPAAIDPG